MTWRQPLHLLVSRIFEAHVNTKAVVFLYFLELHIICYLVNVRYCAKDTYSSTIYFHILFHVILTVTLDSSPSCSLLCVLFLFDIFTHLVNNWRNNTKSTQNKPKKPSLQSRLYICSVCVICLRASHRSFSNFVISNKFYCSSHQFVKPIVLHSQAICTP